MNISLFDPSKVSKSRNSHWIERQRKTEAYRKATREIGSHETNHTITVDILFMAF